MLAEVAVETLSDSRVIDVHPQLVHAESWRRGGVVLLGDSAHGMHNIGGQGVNTSIQDAVVLGAVLARGTNADQADGVDEFERVRRPYIESLQAAPAKLGSGFWSADASSWFAPRFAELSLGQRTLRDRWTVAATAEPGRMRAA